MSDYHILEVNDKQDQARVAFHIAVPNETNAQGVNLQAAVKAHLGAIETQVPWLAADFASELADLQNGAVYEHIETIRFDAHAGVLQKRDIVDARAAALKTTIPDRIRARYAFWGLNRDVT